MINKKDICLAVFVALAWGSYFAISKLALTSFPPLLLGAARFFLLFLLTAPFLFKAKLPIKKIFCLSVIIFLNLVLLNYAIHLSSSLAPIILINELAVPLSTIFGILFFKEKFFFKDAVGICISLCGLAIVIQMRSVEEVSSLAVMLIILAAMLFACYNLLAKYLSNLNIFALLACSSLFIFPQFLLLSSFQEVWPKFHELELKSIYALLYIVLIGTLISHYTWFYLLNKYPMSKIVPFTLLSPLFGCVITAILLHENIDKSVFIGGGLVMLGLAIIQFKRAHDKEKL